jgi:hypothetical protein
MIEVMLGQFERVDHDFPDAAVRCKLDADLAAVVQLRADEIAIVLDARPAGLIDGGFDFGAAHVEAEPQDIGMTGQ